MKQQSLFITTAVAVLAELNSKPSIFILLLFIIKERLGRVDSFQPLLVLAMTGPTAPKPSVGTTNIIIIIFTVVYL